MTCSHFLLFCCRSRAFHRADSAHPPPANATAEDGMAPRPFPATACNVSTAAKWPPSVASDLHLVVGLVRCSQGRSNFDGSRARGTARPPTAFKSAPVLIHASKFFSFSTTNEGKTTSVRGQAVRTDGMRYCCGGAELNDWACHDFSIPHSSAGPIMPAPLDPGYSACPTHFLLPANCRETRRALRTWPLAGPGVGWQTLKDPESQVPTVRHRGLKALRRQEDDPL